MLTNVTRVMKLLFNKMSRKPIFFHVGDGGGKRIINKAFTFD